MKKYVFIIDCNYINTVIIVMMNHNVNKCINLYWSKLTKNYNIITHLSQEINVTIYPQASNGLEKYSSLSV